MYKYSLIVAAAAISKTTFDWDVAIYAFFLSISGDAV
jgi:hypothetical protein